MTKRVLLISVAMTLFAVRISADEGMWLLDSISKLPLAEMKKTGLELTPEQIFSNANPSLKDAIVLLPGGTGGFVSAEGLIVTNHHIAFAGIQELSSVNDDYLKNGFLAATRDKELSTSYTAEIVQTITDVTAEVFSAANDTMNIDERERAIRSKRKEIEDIAQEKTNLGCRVSEMYGGVKYYLFTSLQLLDVRLVYAPPQAIGNFGGEVDNWMWPRHTGDFALLRAYVGSDSTPSKYSTANIPYTPKKFMPVSTRGAPEGSFAMVMGFPGRTFRYREAASVQLSQEEILPMTRDLYKLRMNIIERWSKNDRTVAIKYATKLRRLANTEKKYIGTLEGMKRSDVVATKRAEEERFQSFVASSATLTTKYGSVLPDLKAANDELRTFSRKQILVGNVSGGVEVFAIAGRLGTYLNSLKKDDKGFRAAEEKDNQPVRQFLADMFKDYDLQVDKEILTALILKNGELPADQQLNVFAEVYGTTTGSDREREVREFVDDLYDDTRLATKEGVEKLLQKGPPAILDDDVVKLHRKYSAEASPVAAKNQRVLAKLARLRTTLIEARLEWRKDSVTYPDANRTLRLTYGEVEALAPRDAVRYTSTTTLTGVMEKESDVEEFHVPAKLRELWKKKDFGRYVDATLNDVPVGFLTNLDITGGNSGSPVINGKGELIGCAFDGNWEGVVGDYAFESKYNRTISVDSRYMLFVLDKFSGAESVMKELVIH